MSAESTYKEPTAEEIAASKKEHKRIKRLLKGVKSLKAVKLKDNPVLDLPSKSGVQPNTVYLVLGEVANIHHYILLNYGTGKILPGMYHIEDFVEADEDNDL